MSNYGYRTKFGNLNKYATEEPEAAADVEDEDLEPVVTTLSEDVEDEDDLEPAAVNPPLTVNEGAQDAEDVDQ